jgi:hypothetical protein
MVFFPAPQQQLVPALAMPQLSYLPHSSCLQPGMCLAYPVCFPSAFEATLSSGQPLAVVLAVIEDRSAASATEEAEEGPALEEEAREDDDAHEISPQSWGPGRTSKSQARRERRKRSELRKASVAAAPSYLPCKPPPKDCGEAPVQRLCCNLLSEEGSRQAALCIQRSPEGLELYARQVRKRLGEYMSNAFAASVVTLLLQRIPYGRKAKRGSEFEQLLMEVIEALPRACTNPLGREVYLQLLARVEEEGELPSQTSKLLLERLCQQLPVLVDSSQAATVLKRALGLQSFQAPLLASLQERLASVCRSNEGCDFLSGVLRKHRTPQLAMALLESQACFRLLWRNAKWCSLLVQASSFGHLHQRELAERFRASTPEEQMKIPLSIKRSALWT